MKTVEAMQATYGKDRVHFTICDVTKDDNLEAMFTASEDFFKAPIDILVNNAGVNNNLGWKLCMKVNIIAMMSATQMALERMKNRQDCKIVNIASMSGIIPGIGEGSYAVSKHGAVTLSRTLAANKHEHGVDILCLCPSGANTDIVNKIDAENKPIMEKMIKKMGGLMEPERVGEGFKALMSSKNGTVLSIIANVPLIELPDLGFTRVMLTGGVGQLISKFINVKILDTRHILAAMLVFKIIIQVMLKIVF